MNKIRRGIADGYISPKMREVRCKAEAGFAVSNENLTEESWGWDE